MTSARAPPSKGEVAFLTVVLGILRRQFGDIPKRAACDVVSHVNKAVDVGEGAVISVFHPLSHVGTDCHGQQFGAGSAEELKPRKRNISGGDCAVFLVAALVLGIATSILAHIVKQAGNPCIVLVFGLHVGVGTHAQEFLANPFHGAGVAHKTALALGKVRVILPRSRRATLEEPRADALIEEEAHKVLKVNALDVLDFPLEVNAIHNKISFGVGHHPQCDYSIAHFRRIVNRLLKKFFVSCG